jgi:hypothetical protein
MELPIWQTLAEPKHDELVHQAMSTDAKEVAAIARLRKLSPDSELIRAALTLAEARRKAVAKFGADRAATLWADPAGVEMATSPVVGAYKWSNLLPTWQGRTALDACCGIGGDAMAIARATAGRVRVIGVDADPVRCWMAEKNSGCIGHAADIADAPLTDGPFHIDPARRDASGRRAWKFDDLAPPPPAWTRLIEHRAHQEWGGIIKLGPGLDMQEAARLFPDAAIEIISENGTLVQGLLRFGSTRLSAPSRRATLVMGSPDALDQMQWSSIAGEPDPDLPVFAPDGTPARFLYEPDDSSERAELLGSLCQQVGAPMLHPRIGLLTSDTLIQTPWLTPFEVLDHMPWNERRIKAALDARHAGIVEVKTRGGVVNTDHIQTALRGTGDQPLVVFVLRLGTALRGIIARRG